MIRQNAFNADWANHKKAKEFWDKKFKLLQDSKTIVFCSICLILKKESGNKNVLMQTIQDSVDKTKTS